MAGLREDRFFYKEPIVTQEAFYKSRFLFWYSKTERCPEKSTVVTALNSLSSIVNCYQVISKINDAEDEDDVIRTYTSGVKIGHESFYAYINQQLYEDNDRVLRYIMPLIRRFTSQINFKSPSEACIVYRGMYLGDKQRTYFKIGTIFRFCGFTSTSKSKSLAKSRGNTLFKIHIYAGCPQVRDVSNVSDYPREEEYLFSPYSLFEVTDVYGQTIILRSIDNQSEVGMKTQEEVSEVIPMYQKTTPMYKGTSSTYEWATPMYEATTSSYQKSTPTYKGTTSSYQKTTPTYKGTTSSYQKTTPTYKGTTSSYQKTTPTYKGTTSSYQKSTPTYKGSTSPYQKTTPMYKGTSSTYEWATPMYEGTTPTYEETTPTYEETTPTYEETTPLYPGASPTHPGIIQRIWRYITSIKSCCDKI